MKKTVALLLAVCVMAFLVGCKEKKKTTVGPAPDRGCGLDEQNKK